MSTDRNVSQIVTDAQTDAEVIALCNAIQGKQHAIEQLAIAAKLRAARNADTTGIEESIDMERLTQSGYQRALDQRRRELLAVLGPDADTHFKRAASLSNPRTKARR